MSIVLECVYSLFNNTIMMLMHVSTVLVEWNSQGMLALPNYNPVSSGITKSWLTLDTVPILIARDMIVDTVHCILYTPY